MEEKNNNQNDKNKNIHLNSKDDLEFKNERFLTSDLIKQINLNEDDTHENIQKGKIVISSADGAAGTVGHPIPARILGEPSVLAPMEGYTQTFIGIGSFDLKEQAENAAKYIKTKFCRTLAGILKITQHITPDTFAYVPLQDFTSASDIDWRKPISDIDIQLCKKYGLDQAEIDFIESHVKEMA